MKIMPLTIINIFAVMEIIGLAGDCHDFLRSLAMTIKNNFAIFNYAFSCALKNKFEIISRNENYAFNYNKYFCRNGNNRIGKSISHYEGNARSNPIYLDCHANARNDEFDGDDLFSCNDYGGKFIFGFGNNFNCGFLFNRKIKKIFMSAF